MKYFSMFSGIGGFELGIEKAKHNWTCIGYSEIDKYAIKIYEKHFGGHKNYGDATKIKPEQLPDFDLLVGGFPCQAFSIAGRRKGFEDTRGTLFFEIARILKIKQPRMFLLENVKGLLNHAKGETFTKILQTIDELGYDAEWQVLNSKYFGVPQNRERVFIIGHLRGQPFKQIFPIRKSNQKTGSSIKRLAHNDKFRRYNQTYDPDGSVEALDTSGGGGHQPCIPVLTPDRQKKRQNGRRFKEDGDPMFTLTGQDKHGVLTCPTLTTELSHSTGRDFFRNMGKKIFKASGQIRRLTPVECERLQGFPDGWTDGISDTQRYKTLGNAVTVNVVESIIRRLSKT